MQHIFKQFPFLRIELFNTCLKLAKFPDPLKVGNIILFHKQGKSKTEASSYRPISLLPTIGKVLKNSSPNVSIFTSRRATDLAIFSTDSMRENQQKLPSRNSWIPSTRGRQVVITYWCFRSTLRVPLTIFSTTQLYLTLTIHRIQAFTDDFALVSHAPTRVQLESQINESIAKFSTWTNKNQLQISADKINYLLISKLVREPTIRCQGERIKRAHAIKYLGVYIDEKRNWNTHLKAQSTRATRLYQNLLKIAGNSWGVPLKVVWCLEPTVQIARKLSTIQLPFPLAISSAYRKPPQQFCSSCWVPLLFIYNYKEKLVAEHSSDLNFVLQMSMISIPVKLKKTLPDGQHIHLSI
ncbi:hypothetical protein AVEN_155615-1 [Araneus ventricosus]|uniref:Reverse transcriptase domain-containing protein n=1 Tax=Araneus ventricosus TaxID=182803 RepID=A0A4Y2RXH9_ARAVE|nr:hypothetical protein AVEN_155615-1 [Araneus ventricosus]